MQTRSGRVVVRDEPAAAPVVAGKPAANGAARKPFENLANGNKVTGGKTGVAQKPAALGVQQPAAQAKVAAFQQATLQQPQPIRQNQKPLAVQQQPQAHAAQRPTQLKAAPVKLAPVAKDVVINLLDDDDDDVNVDIVDDRHLQPDHEGLCNMSLEESMSVSMLLDDAPVAVEAPGASRSSTAAAAAAPVAVVAAAEPATTMPSHFEAVDNIDELDDEDPQCVTEYVNDIYQFLRVKEARHQLDANYMQKMQPDLTPGMRAILLDWLADVGLKFKLLNDTTHMTVMLVDRFLATRPNVMRKQLQLVGVACMLIASKYEEIYAPEVRDFQYICDGAFTKEEILAMETHVLNAMGFDVCHPTPLHFLRRFSKAARSDSECHTLAKYLTELAAVHYESLVYAPSLLAAASVLLARTMHPNGDDEGPFVWNATMRHYTGYSRDELQPVAQALVAWGRDVQSGNAKLTAVFRKYSKRFFGVALIPFPADM